VVDTEKAVKVRMLFFGPLAERLGEREIEVALKFGTTVEQLIDRFELSEYLDSGLSRYPISRFFRGSLPPSCFWWLTGY
jgi:molybdopterin converting factor small subunit